MRYIHGLLYWLAALPAAVLVLGDAPWTDCDDDPGNMLLLQVSLQLNTSKPWQNQTFFEHRRTFPENFLQEIDEDISTMWVGNHLDIKLAFIVLLLTVAMTLWFLRSSADSAGQGSQNHSDEASFFTCYFIVFMDAFGFGIFAPFVPVLAKTFGMTARNIAGLLTAFSFAQAFNTPLFGYLSDRLGRRKVLLLAVAGEACAYATMSYARTFFGLLIGYSLAGAFSATIGVCNAYIADLTSTEERPVRMAHLNGSIALGVMTGPVVGGLISNQGFTAACRVCALLSASNFAFTCFCLGDPSASGKADEKTEEKPKIPGLAWLLCIGAFLGEAGMAAWESCAALYIMDSYFWFYPSPATASSQFFAGGMAMSGIIVVFVTVVVFPTCMELLKQWRTVVISVCLRLLGFIGIGLAPTKWLFLVGQGMTNVGDNLGAPNVTSLLTEVSGKAAYGTCLGAMAAFQAMARVIGPILFASLYEDVHHSAPWIAVAMLGAVAAGLWFYVRTAQSAADGETSPKATDAEECSGKAIK
ncbi:unnamed protein product [Durusdinium trenchii]|uniref:Major facilitator superfamily (MFS) profile domain-containing protein n=1 Tax=Durusdinium trenchii TaxID=1381693 RepID=A0ABP0HEM3_9DINO